MRRIVMGITDRPTTKARGKSLYSHNGGGQRTERTFDFDNYIKRLIASQRVQALLNPYDGRSSVFYPMQVYISTSCGFNIGGQLWYYNDEPSILEISSWILVDVNETRRVIRHELAHDIKTYCNLAGKIHGRGFNKALRAVSNLRWKKDKHWHSNLKIDLARKKLHPRIKSAKGG